MSKDRAAQLVDAGLWLKMSGDADGAHKLFERALGLDPTNQRARTLLEGLDAAVTQPGAPAAEPAPAPIQLWQTQVIDARYRIVEKLASGGMGDVFKAVHIELQKTVAMKVMKRDLGATAEFAERFKREAMALSRIGQHNIVDVTDFGRTSDGRFYFVMEYLEGVTLTQLLKKERRLEVDRAARIGYQLAKALGAAHSRGIVHRDLKPDNVMLVTRDGQSDFVKVLDFGVAKINDETAKGSTTGSGMVFGTPAYMSPEQASAQVADARSDIYSLGLILYEMVTGRQTFSGATPTDILSAQITETPPPMTRFAQLAPTARAFEAMVMRMLRKAPSERPQSMLDITSSLERTLAEPMSVVVAVAPSPVKPPTPSIELELPKRSRGPMVAAGVVLLLVLAGVGWLLKPRAEPPAVTPVSVAAPVEAPVVAEVQAPPVDALAAPPASVSVSLETVPPNAVVFDGLKRLGTTPLKIAWPLGRSAQLSFKREGYVSAQRTVAPVNDLVLSVDLTPVPAKPGVPADNLKDPPY